jgi:nitrate reductase alpha subunit
VALRKTDGAGVALPLADASKFTGHLIDFNVRAERMGWLPSAPQLNLNPLHVKARADAAGMTPQEYTVQALKSGDIRFACEQPDNGKTTRVTCLSGARTCSDPPVKAMNIC